jgi:hypothetical protein
LRPQRIGLIWVGSQQGCLKVLKLNLIGQVLKYDRNDLRKANGQKQQRICGKWIGAWLGAISETRITIAIDLLHTSIEGAVFTDASTGVGGSVSSHNTRNKT